MPLEKRGKVGNATVVDVGIRLVETPQRWIRRKGTRHVLIDEELKVDACLTIGSNNDVRADTSLNRYVPSGEWD